jgi:Tfp pilus assembly protein PilP
MKPTIPILATLGLAVWTTAGSADAQQQASQAQAQQTQTPEVTLVYEREVFVYAAAGRRDPFRPLTDDDELGPRFEVLTLQGIIYSTGAGRSIALLADGDGRVHRVRQGDVLGNARVIEIGPSRVVMAVERFGTIRQEMLELQRRGGAQR